MHQNRGGMGSHKHATSGHAPRSPRYKFMKQIDADKEAAELKSKRKRLFYGSVAEAVAKESKR